MIHFRHIVFLILFPLTVQAQDTVYFNRDWLASEKNQATYFSTVNVLPGHETPCPPYVVRDFTMDENILSQCEYIGLTLDIDWSRLYEQGFQQFAIEQGDCTEYYPSGKKKKQFKYVNGAQDGLVAIWSENGNLVREYFAKGQVANGAYKEYFDDGTLSFSVNFVRDTLAGDASYYHPNGNIAQKGVFKLGHKFEKWEYWSESGELVGEEIYRKKFFIEGPDISISFPEGVWCLSGRFKEGERLNFLFSRQGSNEALNSDFVPSCLVSIESVTENIRLIDYSSSRRRRLSISVNKVVSQDVGLFSLSNTMGYLGSYFDNENNKHAAIVVHSLLNNVGVELILDARHVDYENLKKEFELIMRSMQK